MGAGRVKWPSLPGTLQEQRQVADIARKALGQEPFSRTGAAASVAQVMEDLPHMRYAHLATHGFFADASVRSAFQADERRFRLQGRERASAGARSPLVLSGLVLAGANRP